MAAGDALSRTHLGRQDYGGESMLYSVTNSLRAGLIRRTPGVARSIEILVEPEDLPVLR